MNLQNLPSYALTLFLLIGSLSCQPKQSNNNEQLPPLEDNETNNLSTGRPQSKAVGLKEDYVHTDRVIWQKPELVIDLLDDLSNKTVADIGAGTGFFAFRMVLKAKKVIAIDIDPRFISYLDSVKVLELPENYQDRLETRAATADDPNLRENEVDVVVIVNTFMYIKKPVEYLKNLRQGISDGGQVLIVDFKKKRTPIGPPSEYRVPLFQVEEQLYEAGYKNIKAKDTFLDYQYIIIAEK